ncbi:MAG TPA: chromosomal replication initiator protein DnaA [Spirochaetota bacterium]|nr:chromosomal replication initiator protein DnaA [Spirochaetota bacterium]HSA15219.1 chromosomal replication initiator protein DnaA [Spirochaetota bacterium]
MPKELWTSVLDLFQSQINKQSYDMWLKDTEPLQINGNTITIKVSDDVARKHISEQYSTQLLSKIKQLTGKDFNFEFITSNGFIPDLVKDIPENSMQNNNSQPASDYSMMNKTSPLNPNYTFNNFVIGPNNELAHAAAVSIAQSPAKAINPFFIYGGTGLGKTHLMQAIGHRVLEDKPFLKVLYVTSEQFINDFISSIRTNTTQSFKIKYRDVDILLIDDIQFIEKKEETQNEFFHTFNSLYENKKQIIISSDRPPRQLSTLEDRLRSRFEWGMITDIQPPNLETREAILRNKAEREGLDIPDEVLNFIARRIKSNIRALESALVRIKLVSFQFNEPFTVSQAKIHLKELFDDDTEKKISVAEILSRISGKFDVSVDDIVSKSRHSKIVQPRFIAMYLSRRLIPGITTTEIGKDFGDRDHSTVVNAINKIENDMNSDPVFKEQIEEMITEMKN